MAMVASPRQRMAERENCIVLCEEVRAIGGCVILKRRCSVCVLRYGRVDGMIEYLKYPRRARVVVRYNERPKTRRKLSRSGVTE